MARAVMAILAIVIVGSVAVWGLDAAATNAGVNHAIEGEDWTPTAGEVTELDHSNLEHTYYDESVLVYDSNGEVLDPENDYIWFNENGTVYTVVGGDLDGENSATIDYTYQTTTDDQRALIGITAMLPNVIGVLMPLLGIALLLIFIKG